MDKKIIAAIIVVVIVLIAAAAALVVMNNDDDDDVGTPAALADAELKVYGNINGDQVIDQKDIDLLNSLIDDGATATQYPLADANQDGKIDASDVEVIQNVIDGKSTTIWHINYHDTNEDGVVDEELVSTKFPIKASLMTGATNNLLLTFMLGITDAIKGISYTNSTTDTTLFGSTYLDSSKTVRVGNSSTTIKFEDGKAGSSDVIATQGVTAVISDWNRIYLTNESDFENAGIDVVRVDSGATDMEHIKHSALLLGLLFQKSTDRVQSYISLCQETLNYVANAINGVQTVKAVASSMTGRISSATSDYSAFLTLGGAVFGASNVDFGSATSVKVADHPEFYTSDCQYIIHYRTNLNYGTTTDSAKEIYETYSKPFASWQYADTGQYMVSGSIPTTLRVAYTACALHGDVISLDEVNKLHQQFVDEFYNGLSYDISSLSFFLTPSTFSSS